MFNVSEYWFSKDQNRVRDLRVDTLSQMLNLANVRPGGRYIAVDDASGLLVSGLLERLGGLLSSRLKFLRLSRVSYPGEGRLVTICDTDSPPAYPVLLHMNFKPSALDILVYLNWATAEEDYTPSW